MNIIYTFRSNLSAPVSFCPCPSRLWAHHPETLQANMKQETSTVREHEMALYTK